MSTTKVFLPVLDLAKNAMRLPSTLAHRPSSLMSHRCTHSQMSETDHLSSNSLCSALRVGDARRTMCVLRQAHEVAEQ